MLKEDIKRLFFGFKAECPWPDSLPKGRIIDESHRHFTMAFLGNIKYAELAEQMNHLPLPELKVGLVGLYDKYLFLPEENPRVVCWHATWGEHSDFLQNYYHILNTWLQEHNLLRNKPRDTCLMHTTLCRKPFYPREWKKAFTPLPVFIHELHLFESVGNLQYQSLWSHSTIPPFEPLEHTADIAFKVYGTDPETIFKHARCALAFEFPEILKFENQKENHSSFEDIVMDLNHLVAEADQEKGCPFKAVSYHGDIEKIAEDVFVWEMIVDV